MFFFFCTCVFISYRECSELDAVTPTRVIGLFFHVDVHTRSRKVLLHSPDCRNAFRGRGPMFVEITLQYQA